MAEGLGLAETSQRGLARWYSNIDPSSSANDVLQATFAHAKLLLRATVKPHDFESLFPSTGPRNGPPPRGFTIDDALLSLQTAQAVYGSRTGLGGDAFSEVAPATNLPPSISDGTTLTKRKAKARQWLTTLSEKLMYYGNIFDVLAQQHPEYTSLAWGTFKLLFTAIANHAETASKLSKSISQIADILPRHSLHLILYSTPEMQEAVARLYAHVLQFFLSSLKWYNDSRGMHAIKSVFQPWDLKFRPQYEAVAAESQQITRLADLAMKAEMRDARLELGEGTRHLELIKQDMEELKAANVRLTVLVEGKFDSLTCSVTNMFQDIRLDLSSQRQTLNRVHLNQMLDLAIWGGFPTSGECLQFCQSMRKRNRSRVRVPLPELHRLEAWAVQERSTVLFIDTYESSVAKTFMVDLIDLIRTHRLPIIWALRYADYWDRQIGITDIVRMLVLQVMQVGADHLLESNYPVTYENLREAASLSDWIAILDRLLTAVRHAFIVLDAELLAHATAYDRSEILETLDCLRLRMSGHVKIVTSTSCVSRGYIENLERRDECMKLLTVPEGRRMALASLYRPRKRRRRL